MGIFVSGSQTHGWDGIKALFEAQTEIDKRLNIFNRYG
jgi:hypothetical protein